MVVSLQWLIQKKRRKQYHNQQEQFNMHTLCEQLLFHTDEHSSTRLIKIIPLYRAIRDTRQKGSSDLSRHIVLKRYKNESNTKLQVSKDVVSDCF